MATEQQLHTKLPTLAVTIPTTPVVSTPAPSITTPTSIYILSSEPAIAPVQISPSLAPATVSTPTSGMHSPPLSNTVEEEDIEMSSAAAATRRTDPVPPTIVSSAKPSAHYTTSTASSSSHTPSTTVLQPTLATTVFGSGSAKSNTTVPSLAMPFSTIVLASKGQSSSTDSSLSGQKSDDSGRSGESAAVDCKKEDLYKLQQHQNKEKTIEHVLKQGKILKVSRRLRTRLEYAILKIRRGWSKYTLQEVESLIQPVCSPRVTVKQIQQSISRQTSPRPSERRKAKRPHSAQEAPFHKISSDITGMEPDRENDMEMPSRPSAPSTPSTPTIRYRSRMPSLSQYKDSELFQPAKSLMEIATSKPEPGYVSPHSHSLPYFQPGDQSPYHRYGTPEPLYRDTTPARDGRWSGYSTPVAPSTPVQNTIATFEDEEQEGNNVPSAAQAARTILMLSSPTRPPPRTLNQNYIFEMHSGNPTHLPIVEWTAPYSPSTSSPLVQFQTNASSTPSPDRTPSMTDQPGPSYIDEDRSMSSSNQRGSSLYNPKPQKQPYSSLYGMGHEPSSPSPLSTALFPSSIDHLDKVKSHSRSSSPTLKRAVRFAAAATSASESSKMSIDNIKEKISSLSGRTEYNSNGADNIYPGYDDKKEFSPSPYGPESPQREEYHPSYINNINGRASTPPPLSSSYTGHFGVPSSTPMGSHGMRTPPPSGGKDLSLDYSIEASIPRKRRNSGPIGVTDLPTMFRHGASSSPNPSSTNSRSMSRR
ncbi:hypothetical protein BGX26_008197 [Mortierella sp. AD094]|nr:hypothetical protein BGX26_008197 [Mortierella sp. AD094]